jgi:hypothetical protein
MDGNIAVVLVAAIGIVPMTIASILTFIQTRRSEKAQERRAEEAAHEVATVALKLQEAREEQKHRADNAAMEIRHVFTAIKVDRMARAEDKASTDEKLKEIHVLVNDQLTQAVSRFREALVVIDELKGILIRLAPNDPRVQEVTRSA